MVYYYEISDQPYDINAKSLQKFIKNLPNLEDLNICVISEMVKNFVGEPEPGAILKNLKRLDYYEDEADLFPLMLSFIEPDTIKEFVLNGHLEDYHEIIWRHQTKIKALSFDGLVFYNASQIKHLKLERINFSGCDGSEEEHMQLVLDHAESLIELDLCLESFDIESLCTQCIHLQSLSVYATNQDVSDLLNIHRLWELSDLSISFDVNFRQFDILNDVVKVRMDKLKILELNFGSIPFDFQQMEEIFKNIGLYWRNVEILKVERCCLPLNTIIKSLKKLKHIHFDDRWTFSVHKLGKYPSIEELKITRLKYSWTPAKRVIFDRFYLSHRFIKAFPNLKSLDISECEYKNVSQLNFLLTMRQLKQLKIKFFITSSKLFPNSDDVNALKKLCQKVESIDIIFYAQSTCIDQLVAAGLEGEILKDSMLLIGQNIKFKAFRIKFNHYTSSFDVMKIH